MGLAVGKVDDIVANLGSWSIKGPLRRVQKVQALAGKADVYPRDSARVVVASVNPHLDQAANIEVHTGKRVNALWQFGEIILLRAGTAKPAFGQGCIVMRGQVDQL
jgi:hypothetical protein